MTTRYNKMIAYIEQKMKPFSRHPFSYHLEESIGFRLIVSSKTTQKRYSSNLFGVESYENAVTKFISFITQTEHHYTELDHVLNDYQQKVPLRQRSGGVQNYD